MSDRWLRHGKSYHAWRSSTPLLDAVVLVMEVMAFLISGYALLFTAFAIRDGNFGLALRYGLFVLVCGVAVGGAHVYRRWRRHHA